MLATQGQQPIQPTMPAAPHRQTFFSASVFQDHKKEATAASRHRSSMIYDPNKPLPAIMDTNQPAPQPLTNNSKGSQSQQKKQRRMSFLPSALMTSNLAKFMGGSSNGGSPTTSNLSPATSPRTPRSPMAIPPQQPLEHPINSIKEADSESDDGTQLTTEQFKWAMVCCCNEIKSRVVRHRCTPVTEAQVRPCSTAEAAASTIVSGSSSQRKADKNKSGRFGGNNSPSHAIETASKGPQVVMQGLLQVMVSLTDAENKIGSGDDGDGASIHMADSSTTSPYSTPPAPVISRNKSFLSLIGVGSASRQSSAAAVVPKRTRSITQLSHHSSFPALVPSFYTPNSPYPSAHQHQQLHQNLLPQQLQDRPKFLGSKKSQTKLALAQATDAVLSPLSLEELVHLMAYTLTIAPEQWIPWHLYDFFVRPQGMKYRDLIELLPTQSQRILRSLLETVDALVDHAVLIVVQHHQTQQQNLATEKVAPTAVPTTDNGSGIAGVHRLRQQSSQVHLRSKSEIHAGSVHKGSGGRNESAGGLSAITQAMTMAITKPTASSPSPLDRAGTSGPGGEDLTLHEVAIRARKRRAILDSLSGLVFRSRKDITASSVYGSEPTTSFMASRDFSVIEERHKGKRRSSVAAVASGFVGNKVSSTGATAATQALHVQLSEREREAGHKAFENLVYAFEEEYHPHKPAAGSLTATLGGVGAETGSFFSPSALSQSHSAPAAGAMAGLQGRSGPNIPRQSRSLPTPMGPTITDMSAVRSLSLPPWRKHSSTVSLVQQPLPPYHLQRQASSLDPLQKSLSIPSGSASASAPATPTEARVLHLSITQAQLDHHHHPHPLELLSESGSVVPAQPPSSSATSSEQALASHVKQRPLSFPLGINTKQHGDSAGSSSRRRSSARLSATWTSWKDHLLVLEEEEYVIGDTSESEVESSKSKAEEEDEEGDEGTMDAATAAGLQQQAQATRKKSGTFGTLPMMPVGSLEASDQRTDEQEKENENEKENEKEKEREQGMVEKENEQRNEKERNKEVEAGPAGYQ